RRVHCRGRRAGRAVRRVGRARRAVALCRVGRRRRPAAGDVLRQGGFGAGRGRGPPLRRGTRGGDVMTALLVLGAADGSLATYRTARRLGYRTIAVDQRETAPGVALADEHLAVSTREPDRILAALGDRSDLVGVLAPCSDIALPTQRELAARLGLPCGLTEA